MGIGSSLKKVGRSIDDKVRSTAGGMDSDIRRDGRRFEKEYKRWGRKIDPWLKYAVGGAYYSQAQIAIQEGGKKSGYSDEESESLGDGLGANYTKVEARKVEREIGEDEAKAFREMEQQRVAEEKRSRDQIAVRIRRRGPTGAGASRGIRSPSVVAGGLGTTGNAGGSTFAALLGLQ